jgi:hypothetical protein
VLTLKPSSVVIEFQFDALLSLSVIVRRTDEPRNSDATRCAGRKIGWCGRSKLKYQPDVSRARAAIANMARIMVVFRRGIMDEEGSDVLSALWVQPGR